MNQDTKPDPFAVYRCPPIAGESFEEWQTRQAKEQESEPQPC